MDNGATTESAMSKVTKISILGAFKRDMDGKNHSFRLRQNDDGTFSIRPTHRTNQTQMLKTEQLVPFEVAGMGFASMFDIPAGYYRLTGGKGHRGWYVLEPVAITLADMFIDLVEPANEDKVEELIIDPASLKVA